MNDSPTTNPAGTDARLASSGTEPKHTSDGSEPDPRRWWALAVIAVAQLMIILDASIINIALPSAQADLHISNADRQWVVTAYTLAFGGLLLLGGRIADYTGRKRAFIIGLIGFAGASALGGAAGDEALLFAARGLQGAFAALLAPAALALISETFTRPNERAKALSVYGGISGGGAAVGLIMGGVLTEYASWRWCLLVNIPIALLAALAALRLVNESRSEGDSTYDIPGAILVTCGLASLVYSFAEAAKTGVGWLDPRTLGLLGAAAVLLIAFVAIELRSRHPLLPLRVVLDRNRAGAYLSLMLAAAGLFAMFLFLTYYMQQNLGYSPLKSGFAFLPFSAGVVVAAGLASNLMPRIGPKILLVIGGTLSAAGLLDLVTLARQSSFTAHILPAEIAMSLGLGLIFITTASLGLADVDHHDAGVAGALINTSQQIGGSLGTALLNTLFASAISNYVADHHHNRIAPALGAVRGYHIAFGVASAMLAVATVLVLVMVTASKHDIPDGSLPVG